MAQMQLKERGVSPVRPEGTFPGHTSTQPALAPHSVVQSLEDSFAKTAHRHSFQSHRAWGVWAGAKGTSHSEALLQNGSSQEHNSQREQIRSSAVLASGHTLKTSPISGEVSLRQVVNQQGSRSGQVFKHTDSPSRRCARHAQGRVRSTTDEHVSQRMSEASAWEVVSKWRRIVDAAAQSSHTTSQGEYAMDVQTLDVHTLRLIQRKELVSMSGLQWKSILRLQEVKNSAELYLLHNHMGLLTKVCSPC